jgi:hypothetical protein
MNQYGICHRNLFKTPSLVFFYMSNQHDKSLCLLLTQKQKKKGKNLCFSQSKKAGFFQQMSSFYLYEIILIEL